MSSFCSKEMKEMKEIASKQADAKVDAEAAAQWTVSEARDMHVRIEDYTSPP